MKQKKMLALTFSQLKQIYNQEIPEVVEMADKSSSVEEFKLKMQRFLETCRMENKTAKEAREQIRLLLHYDGQDVHELSTGQDMSVQTIRLLYKFLTETLENMEIPTDLFIEIFQMFKRVKEEVVPLPSPQRIKSRNDRWETGLDEEVREVRDENKERMLHLLIQKIENRKSKPSVRFHFEEGMSYEEKAKKVIEMEKLNPQKILTPEQIRAKVDLTTTEGNRTVRLLERESGEKTFLRLYDDYQIFPFESEITAALKRMVMTLPTIGFLSGHGERETDRPGDRNYCMFTHLPMMRQALVNQGFDYKDVTLEKEVPAEINILVIAEMREPMTEIEKVNFDKYVARGGNLVIIGEPGRQGVMGPVLEPFGVKLVDGFLIQPEKPKDPEQEKQDNVNLGPFAGFVAPKNPIDLIVTQPTKEA